MRPITPDEIRSMKTSGYDAKTIEEAEARLAQLQRGMVIADEVRSAFAGVTLGAGVGLLESDGLDYYEDEETLAKYRSEDEKEDWQKIALSDMNKASGGLCFFDAEGMRFHLPAYLIADLKGEYKFGLDFNLTDLSDHSMSQFELLDGPQRACVRRFLIHILDDPDYEFGWEEIERSLVSYWTEDQC